MTPGVGGLVFAAMRNRRGARCVAVVRVGDGSAGVWLVLCPAPHGVTCPALTFAATPCGQVGSSWASCGSVSCRTL